MPHVVLLGDSIFDNQSYVQPGEPDVIHQLRAQLPAGWHATLLAIDGSLIADVPHQLAHLPTDTTHLVISAGGNDALAHLNVLDEPATSVAQALMHLATLQDQFEQSYRRMLATILTHSLPTAVCTIYNGNFPSPVYQRLTTLGAAIYDDVILRLAVEHNLPVLDLRLICADPADYANPIEPSARGGDRIARAIALLLTTHDFSVRATTVYASGSMTDPAP
jgi:lysophospholipase L1-like esterase